MILSEKQTPAFKTESSPTHATEADAPVMTPRETAKHIALMKRNRRWAEAEAAISRLRQTTPLLADYWQMEIDAAMFRLNDPVRSWKNYLVRITNEIKDIPDIDKNITFRVFSHYFSALVKAGDLAGALAEIGNFADVYGRHCPLPGISALAVLFIRAGQYEECLRFLDDQENRLSNVQMRKNFRIKLHESRSACLAKMRGTRSPEKNIRGLYSLMDKAFLPRTPQRQTLDNCLRCWSELERAGGTRLHNVVNDSAELAQLQARIEDALQREKPFSLLRLGDGESYGFLELAKNASEEKLRLKKYLETHWWGKTPSAAAHQSMIDGFRSAVATADILGFPGAYRLARDLTNGHLEKHNPVVSNELKLGTLFSGMERFVRNAGLETRPWLTSEHCNHALSDHDFIAHLIAQARSVILVSGFDIPDGHIFRQPKVSRVQIPLDRRQRNHSARLWHDATLPEVLDTVTESALNLAGPGVLVFVCAGFAGKSIIHRVKKAGAIAIDYGSAIDMTLGRRTRAPELCARYAAPETQNGAFQSSR